MHTATLVHSSCKSRLNLQPCRGKVLLSTKCGKQYQRQMTSHPPPTMHLSNHKPFSSKGEDDTSSLNCLKAAAVVSKSKWCLLSRKSMSFIAQEKTHNLGGFLKRCKGNSDICWSVLWIVVSYPTGVCKLQLRTYLWLFSGSLAKEKIKWYYFFKLG